MSPGLRIAAIVFGTALPLTPAGMALACKCAIQPLAEAMANSDHVFDGTVIEARIGSDPMGRSASVMRVRIDRQLKGGLGGIVTIYSPPTWRHVASGMLSMALSGSEQGVAPPISIPIRARCTI